jgi:hypothetical protein
MRRFSVMVVGVLSVMGVYSSTALAGYTFNFNESRSGATIFNGLSGVQSFSTDGVYKLEFFWLNNSGHDHVYNAGGTAGNVEGNHNYSGNASNANIMQGLRITRVDGGVFDVKSMRLRGQAAAGELTNFTTGAGTFSLYNGSGTASSPGLVSFGTSFSGVTSFVLADPGRAGGTTGGDWDDIVLADTLTEVPAPPAVVLAVIGVMSAGGMGWLRRKKAVPDAA